LPTLGETRKPLEPCSIVIFGASGDLTSRKLIPALYHLHKEKQMPPDFRVIGFARREKSNESWRQELRQALDQFSRTKPVDDAVWKEFSEHIFYCQGDINDPPAYDRLEQLLSSFGSEPLRNNILFYLATLPSQFGEVVEQIHRAGLLHKDNANGWQRIVIEKPFGHDLESAHKLNAELTRYAREDQVFRIDHYLGKETVQNILALRFANEMYEPIWNRGYVDHVQITMAEDIGIGGRAGYYDGIGAARDVIQNHLLQLLALVAMEEPVAFDADSLRMEKEKVLSAVRLPADIATGTARGQYSAGWQGGRQVHGFLEEDGIPADSRTETYAALRLGVDTRRWAGVPFYLRAGKRLPRRMTEIALIFHRAPHLPFSATDTEELGQNALVIRIQPDEGITVRFGSKVPGTAMEVRDVNMDFAYGESFTESSPEAYERLLLDVLIGDPPLFPRQAEVELGWRILDPVEDFWASHTKPDQYPAGSAGPASSDAMMARDGRVWRRL